VLCLETRSLLAGLALEGLVPEVPMSATSLTIPEGDAGTAATIAAMRQLIEQGKADPVVHELAAQILRQAGVRAFDWAGEVRAIYNAVRRNVRFTRDIRGKETLHAAREIIRLQIGDCDDFTILLCSLLETVGVRTRIKTIAADERAPDTFTHVFPEALVAGKWMAVDAARRDPALGRQPRRRPGTRPPRVWDTQSDDFDDLDGHGLNGLESRLPPSAQVRAWSPLQPAWTRGLGAASARRRQAPASSPTLARALARRQNLHGLGYSRRRPGAPAASYGAPQGQGNYGVPALRRLGRVGGYRLGQDDDSGFDWSQLETEIPSIEQGSAQIIAASRASPYNITASSLPITAGQASEALNTSALTSTLESSGPLLLLGLVAVGGILLLRSNS